MPTNPTTATLRCDLFDVVVIGAGVVGCAIARRFTLEGGKVAVLEKGPDILDGASKANSAILHTAFDAPPNSIEHTCIQDGYQEYQQIHEKMGLPLDKCGAYVVAWNDEEVAALDHILAQAHTNGVMDTSIIDAKMLQQHEPNLSHKALAAVAVPGESLIDPWSAPYVYLRQALDNGAKLFCSCEATGGRFDGERWHLETSRGRLNTKQVINAAGLYGDRLDQAFLGETGFNITPRKGQFVVYDKAASKLIKGVILPVPTSRTKGVVVFRTVFGNLVVGPTAEDQPSRSDSSTDTKTLQMLMAAGVDKLPALKEMPITAVYAGLRPASEFKDYQIKRHTRQHWITVGGIRSTGLSGALGIANYVFRLYTDMGMAHTTIAAPTIPQATILAQQGLQHSQRDWQHAGHGEIICHCELVTEREIDKALSGPLAAKSLAGLKRQTRVTMGRCQGFYCTARLAELIQGHFDTPMIVAARHHD